MTLRIGHQELGYGSGRLISIREGTSVRQSFDGAKLMLREAGAEAELFRHVRGHSLTREEVGRAKQWPAKKARVV